MALARAIVFAMLLRQMAWGAECLSGHAGGHSGGECKAEDAHALLQVQRSAKDSNVPFDCDAGIKNWVRGWSVEKKASCCLDYGKGCEVGPSFPKFEWVRIARQVVPEKFPNETKTTYLQNENDMNNDTYMKIGAVDSMDPKLSFDGKYRFKLIYDGSTAIEWEQSSWLTEPSVAGFSCITADCQFPKLSAIGFQGLGASTSGNVVFDGNGQGPGWWNGVGNIGLYHDGKIPAWGEQTAGSMELRIMRHPVALISTLESAKTTATEQWELIAKQDLGPPPALFDPNAKSTFVENADNPDSGAYMKIGNMNVSDPTLKLNSKYRFKLIYYDFPNMTEIEWEQSSWLTEPIITGFSCITVDCQFPNLRAIGFQGLSKSTSGNNVFDGNGQGSEWNSVGTVVLDEHDKIPAWGKQTAGSMELLIMRHTAPASFLTLEGAKTTATVEDAHALLQVQRSAAALSSTSTDTQTTSEVAASTSTLEGAETTATVAASTSTSEGAETTTTAQSSTSDSTTTEIISSPSSDSTGTETISSPSSESTGTETTSSESWDSTGTETTSSESWDSTSTETASSESWDSTGTETTSSPSWDSTGTETASSESWDSTGTETTSSASTDSTSSEASSSTTQDAGTTTTATCKPSELVSVDIPSYTPEGLEPGLEQPEQFWSLMCTMRDEATDAICETALGDATQGCKENMPNDESSCGPAKINSNTGTWAFRIHLPSDQDIQARMEQLAEELCACCEYLEVDGVIQAHIHTHAEATEARTLTSESEYTALMDLWNLDISDMNEKETLVTDYLYNPAADGHSSIIIVFDSGCYADHVEFKEGDGPSRVKGSKSFITRDYSAVDGIGDGHGHGTHCAGIAAGKTYGVAKGADVYCVKVLTDKGIGSHSAVIAACDWVQNTLCTLHGKHAETGQQCIVSMSFGGHYSRSLTKAVDALYDVGIPVVVSAGNGYADAKDVSPASSEKCITVGAYDRVGSLAWFSNWGIVVDIYAPGVDILACIGVKMVGGGATTGVYGNLCNDCTARWSGTSTACPHVAGALAILYSIYPSLTVAEVLHALRSTSAAYGAKTIRDPSKVAHSGGCTTPLLKVVRTSEHHDAEIPWIDAEEMPNYCTRVLTASGPSGPTDHGGQQQQQHATYK